MFRNLSLTQIYTDNYLYSYLHQGLTQMWSLAVEVAFYVVLPLLAYLLLVVLCRRRWRPVLLLTGLAGLALITPAWLILVHTTDFLPDGARLWLPTYLAWFIGGMMLAVLQSMGVRAYALGVRAARGDVLLHRVHPDRGRADHVAGRAARGAVQGGVLRRDRHADGRAAGARRSRSLRKISGGRPMVFLGEISYEIFLIHLMTMELVMVEIVRFPIYTGSIAHRVRGHVRGDGAAGLAVAPVHARPLRLEDPASGAASPDGESHCHHAKCDACACQPSCGFIRGSRHRVGVTRLGCGRHRRAMFVGGCLSRQSQCGGGMFGLGTASRRRLVPFHDGSVAVGLGGGEADAVGLRQQHRHPEQRELVGRNACRRRGGPGDRLHGAAAASRSSRTVHPGIC